MFRVYSFSLGCTKVCRFLQWSLLYIRFSHYVLEFHTNCINATWYFKSLQSIVHRTVLVILVKYHNILYAESISNFQNQTHCLWILLLLISFIIRLTLHRFFHCACFGIGLILCRFYHFGIGLIPFHFVSR